VKPPTIKQSPSNKFFMFLYCLSCTFFHFSISVSPRRRSQIKKRDTWKFLALPRISYILEPRIFHRKMTLCSHASANFSSSHAIIQALGFDFWTAIKPGFLVINKDRNIAIKIIITMIMMIIIIIIGNNNVTARNVFEINQHCNLWKTSHFLLRTVIDRCSYQLFIRFHCCHHDNYHG
jgi:hypothetical protein